MCGQKDYVTRAKEGTMPKNLTNIIEWLETTVAAAAGVEESPWILQFRSWQFYIHEELSVVHLKVL